MDIRDLKPIFEPEVFAKIYDRFTNLSRFAALHFDWVKKSDKEIVINAKQIEKMTDKVYTDLEVRELIRAYVDIIEGSGIRVHINVLPYESDEMGNISASWVREQMDKYELSQRFLAKEFGVDEFVMSKLLNNKIGFTRWHKAAFYYYFRSIKKHANDIDKHA
jgi:hypothetical protein